MVLNLSNNAMMEIQEMAMVAVVNAQKKKDGSVVEVLPITPASVRISFLIKFNYLQKEL